MKIVFLDKDGTLGTFGSHGKGLFPKTAKFLTTQKRKGRKLFVVTYAPATGRSGISDLPLDGYFGREEIDSSKKELYLLPDGKLRNINDDYRMRETFESEEKQNSLNQESLERSNRMFSIRGDTPERRRLQEEINRFFDYWHGLLHKETQEPFDETTRYQNPNSKPRFLKDLHLVKRMISPQGYGELNAVMVGDTLDESTVTSDPKTPLIVISGRVASGEWNLVEGVLDLLFSDDGNQTWVNFEALYSASRPGEKDRYLISLNGVEYTIKKGECDERIIYCP